MLKSCNICGKMHPHGEQCPHKKSKKKNGRREDEFRASSQWKRKRGDIKKRDGFCCVYCRYINENLTREKYNFKDLSVHHIIPLSEDFDLRLEDSNLITLCRAHHEEAEKKMISRMELMRALSSTPPGENFGV